MLTGFIDSEELSVASIHPMTSEHHPQWGHPCKVINEAYLWEAAHPSRSISNVKLAKALGIHRCTLKKRMDELGIHRKYSAIEDGDLDLFIKDYKMKKPNTGFHYIRGHLCSLGIRVQKQRVLGALQHINSVGRLIRKRLVIQRQKYFSPCPNALWHCNGHHNTGARGGVLDWNTANTSQGNGQSTQPIPTWYIPSSFRIFQANFLAVFPGQ